jgi:hypothetical protein
MRAYKRLTIYSVLISVCSLMICFILHYCFKGDEAAFWINVCLALFGSAVLSLFTSLIMYQHEKIKTLEGFVYHTRQILHILNKYQESMSLDDKINFYLDYNDFDKSIWDADYGNMDFFFEHIIGNRKYIYKKIYNPISTFNNAVSNRIWNFRWHLDGSGRNNAVMQQFVDELEKYLIDKKEYEAPTKYDSSGNVIESCKMLGTSPKLETEISQELSRRYYVIMYGKRKARRMTEEESNG